MSEWISHKSNLQQCHQTREVYNQLGQVLEVKRNLFAGQTVMVGAAYKQGAYFAVITQGDMRQQLQVVKAN